MLNFHISQAGIKFTFTIYGIHFSDNYYDVEIKGKSGSKWRLSQISTVTCMYLNTTRMHTQVPSWSPDVHKLHHQTYTNRHYTAEW